MAPSSPPSPISPLLPDDYPPSLPLPLSASIILSALPRDAHTALAQVSEQHPEKIKVRFQPIGSAPALTQRVFKISATNRFETVVGFLRKKLGVRRDESVFCYVNSVFAPGLDEGVGGLWKVSAFRVLIWTDRRSSCKVMASGRPVPKRLGQTNRIYGSARMYRY